MSESEERWLPVVSYEGLYEVSGLGQVRSLNRYTRNGNGLRLLRGRMLKPGRSGRYLTVSLSDQDSHAKTHLVSWLVLGAFVSPRPPGQHALHGRGGPLDNRLENLRWGTRSENMLDKVRDGTDNRGERCVTAKLTVNDVTEIRSRSAAGETQAALAAEFGVAQSSVSQLVTGAHWGWLPGAVPADRGRHAVNGEAHHAAKLTAEIVRECRARHAEGESTHALAREFGVRQPSMHKAVTGQTWRSA